MPRLPFTTAVYSTIKKSGKTAITGGIARWWAEERGLAPEIFTLANDLEQSIGRIFEAMKKSIELSPGYDRDKRTLPGRWKILDRHAYHGPNFGKVSALAHDYAGEAGANPSLTLWSELWGFTREESRRLWEELTPVPTRPDSMRWVETYAGFEGESDLLWHLYDLGMQGHQLTLGELHDRAGNGENWADHAKSPFAEAQHPGSPVPIWTNDTARLMVYWDSGDIARRMPWQQGELGREYYEAQAKDLRPHAFERLHRNHWVSPESAFIPMEWWDRQAASDLCKAPRLGPGASWQDGAFERTPMILGCDAAVSGDCFGVVLVSRRPEHPDQVLTRYSWKFDPPTGGKIDYGPIEELIRELCKRYNVVQIAYDAYQLHEMMTRLTQQGVAWCRAFSQAGDRMLADKQLYDLIRDGRVLHDGSLALRDHVANANAKMGKEEDTRLRIVKKAESRKIDLVVALSMAAFEALRLNL